MTVTLYIITAHDLLHLPDDGGRHELVQGAIRFMTPAGHHHGRLAINITTPLDQYVPAHNLGAVYAAETGVQLTTAPRVGENSCQEIGNRK